MNFVIKQLISALATPLAFALLLAVVAGLLRMRQHRRSAYGLALVALLVAYLGSIVPVGKALLGPLERQYPPLDAAHVPQVSYVVVLGSAYSPHDGVPVSGALDSDGLARIVEGVNLVRRLPDARLIASGGAGPGRVPSALGYAQLARELGVPASSIIVLEHPLDTWDEANAVVKIVGTTSFLLVTSASHMPRAMRLMQRAGTRPIPAPTAYHVGGPADVGLQGWIPSSRGLRNSEQAIHEYVGLLLTSITS